MWNCLKCEFFLDWEIVILVFFKFIDFNCFKWIISWIINISFIIFGIGDCEFIILEYEYRENVLIFRWFELLFMYWL